MRYIISSIFLLALMGCETAKNTPVLSEKVPDTPVVVPSFVARPSVRPKMQLPPTERPKVTTASFGTTVASLGNVAEPGLWMKTPLVAHAQKGKVTAPNGKSITLNLIPLDGPKTGASRMSLAAMQALGLPVTGLPEVAVSPF